MASNMSNNKMFKTFLFSKRAQMKASLRDETFIASCREEWKMMTDVEKMVALSKADDMPARVPSGHHDLCGTDGEDKSPEAQLAIEQTLNGKLMAELVDMKITDDLVNTRFYFMSSNVQCVADGQYRPLEVALVEYTIRKGIGFTFHSFIDCGDIPCGLAYQAINHSNTTHRIPTARFELASNDFRFIGDAIISMLANSRVNIPFADSNANNPSPMIVMSLWHQMDQNAGVLKWLANKYNDENSCAPDWGVNVLDASRLLLAIHDKFTDKQTLDWCRQHMSTSAFDYSPDTLCSYHDDIECLVCALGVAKRMAYVTSHTLLPLLQLRPTPAHFPIVTAVNRDDYQYVCNDLQSVTIDDITDESRECADRQQEAESVGKGRNRNKRPEEGKGRV